MKFDQQSQSFIDAVAASPLARFRDFELAELRKIDTARNPVSDEARAFVSRIDDRAIDGPNGPVPIRIYTPFDAVDAPVVVYLHGGGFGLGSIDVYDYFVCLLCRESQSIVVSVDYRLAPEFKFPKGLHDAYAAYQWVRSHRAELGTANPRTALCGDSAGAALAASITLMDKARGLPSADYQVLIYPMIAGDEDTPARTEMAEGYYVTRDMIHYYMERYVETEAELKDPLVTPLLASDHSALPPALIITAQYDPFRDDGFLYAEKLRAGGVDVIYTEYGRTVHAFVKRPGMMEKGIVAVAQIGATLRSALGRGWDAA